MNRRDALKAGLGVLTAQSVEGKIATISTKNPIAFVITATRRLNMEQHTVIRHYWKQAFVGTPYEKTPVVILSEGLNVEVIEDAR